MSLSLLDLRALHTAWADIKLDQQRASWDSTALELANNEERFANSRKQLATLTKSFRASEPAQQLENIGSIVKAYQVEVDQLTRRAKTTQTQFMSLYKLLYDLPEPTVALAAAISDRQKANDAEAELKTVKDTLSEYDKEFGKLKNQDVTVRRLEDENKQLMAKMETRVQSVCDEVRRQLTEDFEQRNARAREREHELLMQSQSLRTQLDRALNVQIEKAVSDHQNTNNVTNDDSAVEQLTEELRQSNALIMELKHAKQELQHKLLNQQSSVVVHDEVDSVQLEQLKAQVKTLQETIRSKDDELVVCKKNVVLAHEKAESAAKQCSQLDINCQQLRAELESRPTLSAYLDLKSQFTVLQTAQYDGELPEDSENTETNGEKLTFSESERALVKIKRHLNSKVVALQLEVSAKQAELSNAESKIAQLTSTSNHQQTLLATLRESKHSHLVANSTPSVAAPAARRPLNSTELLAPLELSPWDETDQSDISSSNTIAAEHTIGEASLAALVQQRDKLKSSLLSIEQEKAKLQTQNERLTTEINVLRTDNVNLYGKIRYLESLQARSASAAPAKQSNDLEMGFATTEAKYRKLHEESENPFAQFAQQQRLQSIKSLSAADRLTLSASSFFLGRKPLRMFLLFYALTLHVLVFMTLFFHTSKEPTTKK